MIPTQDLRRRIASLSGQVAQKVVTADEVADELRDLRLRLAIANKVNQAYPNGVTDAQRIRVVQILNQAVVDVATGDAA